MVENDGLKCLLSEKRIKIRLDTLPIGSIKTFFDDVSIEVCEVDTDWCEGCFFQGRNDCWRYINILGYCSGYDTIDGKNRIFKLVE